MDQSDEQTCYGRLDAMGLNLMEHVELKPIKCTCLGCLQYRLKTFDVVVQLEFFVGVTQLIKDFIRSPILDEVVYYAKL